MLVARPATDQEYPHPLKHGHINQYQDFICNIYLQGLDCHKICTTCWPLRPGSKLVATLYYETGHIANHIVIKGLDFPVLTAM